MRVMLWAVGLMVACVGVARAEAPATAGYAGVLKACVKDGRVDYAAVKAHGAALDAYLKAVAEFDARKLGPDAKAFYINAYNALVLKDVVTEKEKGALKSVLDVKGFFDVRKHRVAGEDLTFNGLEEKKIRTPFGDARIHFAVNCASASCPALSSSVWETATLDANLDAAARAYLATPHGLKTGPAGVSITRLMEWYQADFGGKDGVTAFLVKYAPPASVDAVKKGPITFHEYDWTLNAR